MYAQMIKTAGTGVKSRDEMTPEELEAYAADQREFRAELGV